MTASDLSRIERKVLIHAPRERVWRALTDSAEFSKWFRVEAAGAFTPGARVDMKSTYPGYEGASFYVVIERMDPPHTFSWRWHPGMHEPGFDPSVEPMTLVVFQLEEVAGGTELTVVESGFDQLSLARRARVFADNQQGWEIQMSNVAKYLHAPARD